MTILRAMLAIGATAIGLAIVRTDWIERILPLFDRAAAPENMLTRISYIMFSVRIAVPLLYCWSFALSFMSFVLLRRHVRDLLLQPGTLACLATSVFLCGNAVNVSATLACAMMFSPIEEKYTALSRIVTHGDWVAPIFSSIDSPRVVSPSVAVLALWAFLFASGVRKVEQSWEELAGRVVGVGWLSVAVSYYVSVIIDQYTRWQGIIPHRLGVGLMMS